jgi:poly(glycerol-phosphate) alpha-glucosyltransferase
VRRRPVTPSAVSTIGGMTASERAFLHFPVNTLALRRGGLVKAVMLRANALAAAGRPVVIEVLAFQPRLEEDVADLVLRGFLDARVHVRSILRCLDPAAPRPDATDPVLGCVHHGIPPGAPPRRRRARSVVSPAADPRAVVLADHRPGVAALLPGRVKPQLTTRDDAERLRHTDTVSASGQLVRREEYGSGDRVVRALEFRPGDQRPVVQRWLGRDGACFLSVWQAPGSRNWTNAFAGTDGLHVLANPQALYRFAFEHALKGERDPVLFSEFREGLPNVPGRGLDEVVKAVDHPTLRRVAVVHSNHALMGERELPLRSSANFTALLAGLDKWDLLVAATEQQCSDIAGQYGHADRVRAIAHYTPDSPTEPPEVPVDADRFVLVARIHRKKRVDEAIEVFALVVEGNPRARLDIYGFGYGDELEARVMALVKERGLSDHVVFQGFVDDTAAIYAGACATLQTSESEGFGMALLESLSLGVPVVAYDVAYGAREAVRDGVDGFVVPWGDRQAMARRLLDISTDPQLRRRLGDEGPAGAARFSLARYVAEWRAALDGLPRRVDVGLGPDARVVDGRLELRFAGPMEATAVLRARGRGDAGTASLSAGTARLELPDTATGDIYDVFVRGAAGETRTRFAAGSSDDPTWRVYATEHGNLSLKKVGPGTPAAASSGAAARSSVRRVAQRLQQRRAAAAGAEPS